MEAVYAFKVTPFRMFNTGNILFKAKGLIVINDNLKMATTFSNHFTTQFTHENQERIPDPVKMFQEVPKTK